MSWEVLLAPQTKSFKEFMNMIQYNLSTHGCESGSKQQGNTAWLLTGSTNKVNTKLGRNVPK